MEIFKQIARFILKDELNQTEYRINKLQRMYSELKISKNCMKNEIHIKNDEIQRLVYKIDELSRENYILPQSVWEFIVTNLPDAKDWSIGKLSKDDIKNLSKHINGFGYDMPVTVSVIATQLGIQYTVKGIGMNYAIDIKLKKQKLRYNILGVDTEIDVFSWDMSNVRVALLDDETFRLMTDFIYSQQKVLNDIM